uniref:NADH dehydrogenase subunit 2 n=1 Tax=Spirocerca lupi TaxID=304461 RepID=M9QFX0_9BILA|nr:NADH dehydrogenase subunit 2 [Spirocerca lupi]AGI51587.1 NADH dehydrogenase subunit 2 [Spirocerca lupi]
MDFSFYFFCYLFFFCVQFWGFWIGGLGMMIGEGFWGWTLVWFFLKEGVFWVLGKYIFFRKFGVMILGFKKWKYSFVIEVKFGFGPFPFWGFSSFFGISKGFWGGFLTFQKLPYFVVFSWFFGGFFFLVLFLGVIFFFFSFFLVWSILDMGGFVFSKFFKWVLFLGLFFFGGGFFFVFFYYFVMFFIILYVCGKEFTFFGWELGFFFFKVPLSVTFFLKIMGLFGTGVYFGFFYLFLLLLMVMKSLGVGFWFFYISMVGYNCGVKYYDYFFFLLWPFMLFVYF